MQPQRGERLDLESRRDAGLVAIALELAAHDVARRRAGAIGRNTFACSSRIASRYGAGGRLHREERDDLQQVVLDDVADRAGLLVELAAALRRRRLSAIVICTLST